MTAPYRNKEEFAKFVKVAHTEPTEPQDHSSQTFYGVMSKIYKDAYETHNSIVTSPEYKLARQEFIRNQLREKGLASQESSKPSSKQRSKRETHKSSRETSARQSQEHMGPGIKKGSRPLTQGGSQRCDLKRNLTFSI